MHDDLFERNSAAFRRHAGTAWRVVEGIQDPASTLVDGPNGPDNVNLGSSTLYRAGAGAETRQQLDSYFEDPDRLKFSTVSHCNLVGVSFDLFQALKPFAERHLTGEVFRELPVVDIGYCFVFGVGLGHHLPELFERTGCKVMAIVEPVHEFLRHSMRVIDWAAMFEKAESEGREIHILPRPTPLDASEALFTLIEGRGRTFLNGSYAYHHYYSWELRKTRELFNAKMDSYHWSKGYFEDEVLMMRNALANYSRYSFRMVSRRAHLAQTAPMLIVASGPSLDADLPQIARLRDSALICSAGTALGILLKNGIRPDFHVENENSFPLVNNLRRFRDAHGLQGIVLLASSTVAPEAVELFDEAWFFLRAGLSSTELLSGGHQPLVAAAPLVANAAFSALSTLGFRHLYLFGVDCGRRPDTSHHSKDAVYLEPGYDNWLGDASLKQIEDSFDREVPGNFGGVVETSWKLEYSLTLFLRAQQLHDLRLFNCSNGAAIPGARPKAAAALRLLPLEMPRDRIVASVAGQLHAYSPGTLIDADGLTALRRSCDVLDEIVPPLVAETRAEDSLFSELDARLRRRMSERAADLRGISQMARETMYSGVRVGAYIGGRIDDEGLRAEFMDLFLDRFEDMCERIADQGRDLFDQLIAEAGEARETTQA